MKRGLLLFLFVVLMLIESVLLGFGRNPLSDAEAQKLAEDYARFVETLASVGYEVSPAFKVDDAMEVNLRRLWRNESAISTDPKHNVELLLALKNFDFIAEGLRTSVSLYHPYYQPWPKDSQYSVSYPLADFSHDEVLWLMLLLPDADIPAAHAGLRDVLLECAEKALRLKSSESVMFYYEITAPGLLQRLYSTDTYMRLHYPAEMANALQQANGDVQSRLLEAIDVETFLDSYFRPTRLFSFTEADEILREFPPAGAAEGGYIRIVEPLDDSLFSYRSATVYQDESDALVAVTNPAKARFAVYEFYGNPRYYSTYSRENEQNPIDVYLLTLNIRIVDLLTGEEIYAESVWGNPPPESISFSMFSSNKPSDGAYYHDDFDFGRYAAVMEAYIQGHPIH